MTAYLSDEFKDYPNPYYIDRESLKTDEAFEKFKKEQPENAKYVEANEITYENYPEKLNETNNPKLCGNKMKEAYQQGKDLYAMIAQAAFNNDYSQNLEFYPPGYEVEIDGKKVVSGKDKQYEVEVQDNCINIDWYDLVPTTKGNIQAAQLTVGSLITSSEGNLTVAKVERKDDKVEIYFS